MNTIDKSMPFCWANAKPLRDAVSELHHSTRTLHYHGLDMNDFDKSKGWTTLGIIDNFFLALRDVMFASANVQPVYGYVSAWIFSTPEMTSGGAGVSSHKQN